MVEIYNIDVTTHERFARDQLAVEAFRKQYHVPSTGERTIAIQTKILDYVPKHPAISLLLQVYQKKTWALFGVPKNFYEQRFTSSYIAPSLGSQDKLNADIQKIHGFVKQKTAGRVREKEERQRDEREQKKKSEEEEIFEEGEIISELLEKGVKETNAMVDFVIAKMHQFVAA